jgi:protein-tyrosine-phosphatase
MTLLFACTHNAGRSQMAAALCRHLAGGRVRVESAGTAPAAAIHPVVAEVLRERGLDVGTTPPQRLTEAVAGRADVLVTMGCGETCPVVPGVRVVDWPLDDPKGQPIERVRALCDDIERRVRALLAELHVPID